MKKDFKKTLHILIVENNLVDSRMLDGMLSKSLFGSFDLKPCDTLADAFKLLAKHLFDVVLLDLNLTDSAGIDTLKKVHDKYPDLPIVVNTGAYQDDLGLMAITRGAQDYLIKGMYKPYGLIKSLYYAVERKKAESDLQEAYNDLKETQDQLIQVEKMNVVGELASGVAHEVKNPLATIIYGVEYLKTALKTKNEKVTITLQSMMDASSKANSIIKNLLDFSSLSVLKKSMEDINAVIEQSLNFTRHQCESKSIKVVKRFGKRLPKVEIDKNRIEQVIVDLVLNAIFVMKNNGEITIKTSSKKITKQKNLWLDRRGTGHLKAGDRIIVIDIEDTGPGISTEHTTKVFDPFFTTRRAAGGVGLGLSISRTIMKNHSGHISLTNIKGGARARLIFRV